MAESKNTHALRGKVVSNSFVTCLYVCTAVLVVLNGVTCGLAGYEQGESGTDALLAALAYAFGEALLLLFAYLTVPAMIGRAAGFAVCWSLFALGVWASASFYCAKQYSAEHAGTESLRSEMVRLEEQREKLDITQISDRGTIQKLSNRIDEASRELRKSEASGVGGAGNAIYKFAARTVGVSVEIVILAIRLAWSMTFALAAISLGSYIHSVRRVENAPVRTDTTKEREPTKMEVAETAEEEVPVLHFSAPSQPVGKSARYRRTDREDGSELWEHVYERVRRAVESGEVKPSVARIKELAKGTDNAYLAIDRLIKEGVICQSDNGRYQLVSA